MVHFGSDELKVFTGSDDMTVRCWDVPTESEAIVFEGHQVSNGVHIFFLSRRGSLLPSMRRTQSYRDDDF
jgi:WD40 repeat protein